MRHITLIAVSDEFDNKPGLALKGANTGASGFAADREGILIAHDLLEHVNGPGLIGSVWDELEALGAIWQVRARHGDLFTGRPQYHIMAVNIAGDITRMFDEWVQAEECYTGPGERVGTRKHDYDSEFLECIAIARHDIPKEHDDFADQLANVENYLALALRRMRNGFRKAQKRYGDGFKAANQFVAIREAVADLVKSGGDAGELYEGQAFTLSYGNERAHITERYDT